MVVVGKEIAVLVNRAIAEAVGKQELAEAAGKEVVVEEEAEAPLPKVWTEVIHVFISQISVE